MPECIILPVYMPYFSIQCVLCLERGKGGGDAMHNNIEVCQMYEKQQSKYCANIREGQRKRERAKKNPHFINTYEYG